MIDVQEALEQFQQVIVELKGAQRDHLLRLLQELQEQLGGSDDSLTLGDRILVGDISNSHGIAIGRYISMQINQIGLPDSLLNQLEQLLVPHTAPEALSPIPRQVRPFPDISLVGRQDDLEWLLTDRDKDKLIVGQPGAGKTFLLRKLVAKESALFVVNRDPGHIAAELAAKQPRIVILDDAHVDHDMVAELCRIRASITCKFAIVATSWPGARDEVQKDLSLGTGQVRVLRPLSSAEVVDVIRAAGLRGPDDLVRLIRDQSDGRPGLAVTLTHLLRQGDTTDIIQGTALRREMKTFIDRWIGRQASEILAVIALAGDVGMSIGTVAKLLDLNRGVVWQAVTQLGAAGVISQVETGYGSDTDVLVVRPALLRAPLISDVFFCGPPLFTVRDLLDFIDDVPDIRIAAVSSLLEAASLCPDITLNTLLEIVQRNPSEATWAQFARSGCDATNWLLDRRPAEVGKYVEAALYYVPERALPLLLDAAVDDRRELHSTPEHPLRSIKDWIGAAYPGTGVAVSRRRYVLDAASDWLEKGSDVETGVHALTLALLPSWQGITIDPRDEDQLNIRSGMLSADELQQLLDDLWPQALQALEAVLPSGWHHLRKLIHQWAFPLERHLAASTIQQMKLTAGHMTTTLVPYVADHVGPLSSLNYYANALSIHCPIPVDPEFEILCGEVFPSPAWKEKWEEKKQAIQSLGREWAQIEPAKVAAKLAHFLDEAQLALPSDPTQNMSILCSQIAAQRVDPIVWLRELIGQDLPSPLLLPFLAAGAQQDVPGWTKIAGAILSHAQQKEAAIRVLLGHPNPPPDLLDDVYERLAGQGHVVAHIVQTTDIAEERVLRLLQHSDPGVAVGAAEGEWYRTSPETVRPSLWDTWLQVISHHFKHDHDYLLTTIFTQYPDVALPWLQQRLHEDEPNLWRYHEALETAVEKQEVATCRGLLSQVPDDYSYLELRRLLFLRIDYPSSE